MRYQGDGEKLHKRNSKNALQGLLYFQYFVSHKYTNYSAVHDTHRRGHEIAVHSIT